MFLSSRLLDELDAGEVFVVDAREQKVTVVYSACFLKGWITASRFLGEKELFFSLKRLCDDESLSSYTQRHCQFAVRRRLTAQTK